MFAYKGWNEGVSKGNPSFPHALSGNPGKPELDPRLKAFGGDAFRRRIPSPLPQNFKGVLEKTKLDTLDSKPAARARCESVFVESTNTGTNTSHDLSD